MRILAFASARDGAGFSEIDAVVTPAETPREILSRIAPRLVLEGVRLALDYEYCSPDAPVGEAREMAIIPPVSGG